MTGSIKATLALAAALAMASPAVPAARNLESLGQPCRAKQILAGRIVLDRTDGRERFILTNDNEAQGLELFSVDFEKNAGRMYLAPAGAGSWALAEVPGDRLLIGTFFDGSFVVFDLKTGTFTRTARFPGEEYILTLAPGGDGRVYAGTYPGAKLGALDLSTYAVEDLGAPAPPNLYLRGVRATPSGQILCSLSHEKPTTLLYDPAAKEFRQPSPSLAGVAGGILWDGCFLSGERAFRGETFEPVIPPPFPAPPAEKGAWSVDSELTRPEALVIRQGNAFYRLRKGDRELELVAEIDLRGGRAMAAGAGGEILGVRGPDYFVIRPGDRELALRPIPVEGRGRSMLFLKAGPDGRLWGGPHFGQTLFWLDPKTKKFHNTGVVCDLGGEVYDTAFAGGRIYTVSYIGGDILCYEPGRPWDQWNLKNPRPVAKVGPEYVRPTGGIVLAADGRLYSGWMAKYGTYGGAVAATDPESGRTELIENPLGAQAVEGLAVEAGLAFLGTSLTGNGLPAKKGESPKFGVLDLATRAIVFKVPFEGARTVHGLVHDARTGRVAMLVDGALRVFDPRRKSFIDGSFPRLPEITAARLAGRGQGSVYAGAGREAVRIDLVTGVVEVLTRAPSPVTNITVDGQGTVYIACEAEVYRLD